MKVILNISNCNEKFQNLTTTKYKFNYIERQIFNTTSGVKKRETHRERENKNLV